VTARRVLIAGGGITGLSAAYNLERSAAEQGLPVEIKLVERANRLGGKLGTESLDGLLIDIGPDSFMVQKPWAIELCREIGLESEIISSLSSRFYMLMNGELHAVPHELVSLVPTKPEALWKTTFISLSGKMRATKEGLIPQRGDIKDESLSSFMRRRFGDEFASHFAEPLMGGVHAGNPDQMSMAAIYPSFWEMERKHGSITKALLEARLAAMGNGKPRLSSPFVALRRGMQSLVDRLREKLEVTRIRTGVSIDRLYRTGDNHYRAILSDGAEIEADSVLLTTPAYAAADLLKTVSPDAAELLDTIPYASTAVVTLAYRREQVRNPLEGTGFLVPRDQGRAITGCTWSSNKWEGRSPDDLALMRVFMGHAGRDTGIVPGNEERLARTAHEELAAILGIENEPVFHRTDLWRNSMPQYRVGHLDLVDRIARNLDPFPGLILAGSAYRGVGIPDCVRQGREAAEQALRALAAERKSTIEV
jgi:oxygen-dependent protoporphyrinogen oxidase